MWTRSLKLCHPDILKSHRASRQRCRLQESRLSGWETHAIIITSTLPTPLGFTPLFIHSSCSGFKPFEFRHILVLHILNYMNPNPRLELRCHETSRSIGPADTVDVHQEQLLVQLIDLRGPSPLLEVSFNY